MTSGFRFHPVEIMLSLVIKTGAIMAIGAHPLGVLLFEILLNAGSLFNHSNIKIPHSVEKILSLAVITPKLHLVHHSSAKRETNSNFGFTMSIWDRFFGTLQQRDSFEEFEIGLENYRKPSFLQLPRLLTLPLDGEGQSYSMNPKTSTSPTPD